jgi:hypothetical protein
MSRNIDWTKPLSDEDRVWAEQFPLNAPLIEANDAEFAKKPASFDLAGDPDEDEGDNYEDLTVGDLQAEINARNEANGTSISPKGKKDELIERLRADDAAGEAEAAK